MFMVIGPVDSGGAGLAQAEANMPSKIIMVIKTAMMLFHFFIDLLSSLLSLIDLFVSYLKPSFTIACTLLSSPVGCLDIATIFNIYLFPPRLPVVLLYLVFETGAPIFVWFYMVPGLPQILLSR
jgi:hypothetical protein